MALLVSSEVLEAMKERFNTIVNRSRKPLARKEFAICERSLTGLPCPREQVALARAYYAACASAEER
jgi:hypothetical protein